jgi:murein DD-endopeptidase MepM/ murein hydrolase activator NlpD
VAVARGAKVGEVGNWLTTEAAATTAHLHFEIRKQYEMCGEYDCTVASYWTLLLAYERLIRARGTEVTR